MKEKFECVNILNQVIILLTLPLPQRGLMIIITLLRRVGSNSIDMREEIPLSIMNLLPKILPRITNLLPNMPTITCHTSLPQNMIDIKLLQPEGPPMSISIVMMWILLLLEEIKQHPPEKHTSL